MAVDLRLTKEQEELQFAVRHFAETEVASAVPAMEEEDRFPSGIVKRMAQLGFMGIPVPERWGGMGADFVSYAIAVNELSKISAAAGVILSVHTSVCMLPILAYGTDEQRETCVRRLAAGESLGAFALTEPHAGSDAASIRTAAGRSGDGYELTGSKLFITNAGEADIYLTFAVTDPAKGSHGITALVVRKDMDGFSVGPKERKMGLRGSNTCELIFDRVKVPPELRLGEEGQGFAIAMGSLDGGRIGIAAQALGIAEAALRLLEERFVRSPGGWRKLRGAAWKHVYAELEELTGRAEAARLLVYRAAWLRQEGKPCTKEASMAKLFASDTAVAAAGAAVRLSGADGCVRGSAAERLFRDAKITQIYEGTNEIHRIVISGRLLK